MCEERLSDTLYLQWARKLSPQSPAWTDESSMQFDRGYRPVVAQRDLLWSGKWGLMLRGATIFPQGNRAFDLLTGKQRTWTDARGNKREWTYPRSHGCGPKAAGEHLLTFRSGCAGFVDLKQDSGTANLGGFRSGCTANLIAADGVLGAPDYTRTCGCAYQNRSSLGLVHMPDVEYWAYGAAHTPGRVGFNLGAPGDRRDPAGTLWRAVPNVPDRMARDKTLWWGNPGAVDHRYVGKALVETVPRQPRAFYHHASRVQSDEPLICGIEIVQSN